MPAIVSSGRAVTVRVPRSLQKERGVELPPEAAKHRRVRLLRPSCMTFTPCPPKTPGGPSRTRARIQCYVDPGIKVPGKRTRPYELSRDTYAVSDWASELRARADNLPVAAPQPSSFRSC